MTGSTNFGSLSQSGISDHNDHHSAARAYKLVEVLIATAIVDIPEPAIAAPGIARDPARPHMPTLQR